MVNTVSERVDAAAAKIYSLGSTLDAVNLDELPIKTIFFAFSGPAGRADGFEVWARRLGVACGLCVNVIMADLVNGMDLSDELEWESLLSLRSRTGEQGQQTLWCPPCSSFTVSGEHHGSQPVLRAATGPALHGVKDSGQTKRRRSGWKLYSHSWPRMM